LFTFRKDQSEKVKKENLAPTKQKGEFRNQRNDADGFEQRGERKSLAKPTTAGKVP